MNHDSMLFCSDLPDGAHKTQTIGRVLNDVL